jgi:putative hydrolase of the HAD superfamily
MSGNLGYSDLFDHEFYSCRMGVAKPAPAYFHAIVDELELSAGNVLFLDDNKANVNSAREVGLHAAEFILDSGSAQLARTLVDFGIHVV